MGAHLKILLLEDSIEDAELVQRLLCKHNPNFRFLLAANKNAYLQGLDTFAPDIILSDNSLPQFSALAALKIVRERSLYIPFILVTGTVSDEYAASIIKSGADDYIIKDRLTRLPAAVDAAIQKRQSEIAIRDSEEMRKLIMNASLDAIVCADTKGRITIWNPQAEKMFGWKQEEITGQMLDIIIPEQYRGRHGYKFGPWLQKNKSPLLNTLIELLALHRAGYEFPVELAIVPIRQDNHLFYCAFIRDISVRKKAEDAMRAMELEILDQKVQEQKKISRAIIRAQERERNHIGQELHDNVNQLLASTKIFLSSAGKKTPAIRELLQYPMELIDDTIAEIRALTSRHVTPTKNVDLQDLVQLLLDKLRDNSTTEIIFVYHVDRAVLDDELKLNIYRIIQEQINNIIKHAAALNVIVEIELDDINVNIRVIDDGKGFDPYKKRKGIGISNMINRIESFNGRVKIDSSPGNGCRISISMPVG